MLQKLEKNSQKLHFLKSIKLVLSIWIIWTVFELNLSSETGHVIVSKISEWFWHRYPGPTSSEFFP